MQVNKYNLIVFFLLFTLRIVAQEDSVVVKTQFQLNLKDDLLKLKPQRAFGTTSSVLMDVTEDNFTTPAAVSVITREEIEKSGVQSLAEAFRLLPGCMVRERSKGNFDISVSNTAYLVNNERSYYGIEGKDLIVLINGIPILQRTGNNIWWESLPNISSIDQIELLTGPSVAIYGITSSGGLINIVTRKMSLDKLKVVGDGAIDQNGDHSLSTYVESALSERFKGNASFDYRFVSRPNTDYFVYKLNRYITKDSLLFFEPTVNETNKQANLSVRSFHLKSHLEFKHSDDISANLVLEHQNSQAQTALYNQENLFLNERQNKTTSASLFLKFKKMRASLKRGFGANDYIVGEDGYNYLTSNWQLKVDFPFQFNKISIHPGVFYNSSAITTALPKEEPDNVPYIDADFNSYGTYAILEYTPTNKIRFTSNLSYEHFPLLNRELFAANFAFGYSVTEKLFFRLNAGRSFLSPNIESSIRSNLTLGTYDFNQDLKPILAKSIEAGVRVKASTYFEAEFSTFIRQYSDFQNRKLDFIKFEYYNYNTEVAIRNVGLTANLKFKFENLTIRPFVTYIKNSYQQEDNAPKAGEVSPFGQPLPYTELSVIHPTVFGGLSVNYATYFNRLNFNILLYANNAYNLSHTYNGETVNYSAKTTVSPYFKVSYKLKNESKVYFVAKNFLSKERVEYPFADYIQNQFLIGFSFNFITK